MVAVFAQAAVTNSMNWMASTTNTSLTVPEAGKSKIKVLAFSIWWGLSSWLADGHFHTASSHGSGVADQGDSGLLLFLQEH